ncbi:MAG: hypothetical protein QN183_04285 [Armatimonadota bacterium]|nr:hypothetical protein [Armatimonadota bacterium]MDR7486408.1 hypothetical protein [Armatimonadota bacterium]MDR7532541.1 hypothetical protein [Armatimonadota bacterium]MDR7535570.1 hypothetical protein [Armatimonadota bacterium]
MTAPTRFLVLARRRYPEALTYQGTLEVAAGGDPAVAATTRFGADWLELVLAPEVAVHWVIAPQALESTA